MSLQIGIAMWNGTKIEGIESRIWFQYWCYCFTKISSLRMRERERACVKRDIQNNQLYMYSLLT